MIRTITLAFAAIVLTTASTHAACTKNCGYTAPPKVCATVTLASADWDYIKNLGPGRKWWCANSSNGLTRTPNFVSQSATFCLPRGADPLGYRGKVSGKQYTFRFR